ncbi:MAG TPA: palindromic element RPE4 domain-containing protein [Rickettsia endosymbiont of Bembidion lapponicum]|nr:palindromic element RPE4 domain-containing protein [Rickettsia endosymbiont of Bembidion lapponicum]
MSTGSSIKRENRAFNFKNLLCLCFFFLDPVDKPRDDRESCNNACISSQ